LIYLFAAEPGVCSETIAGDVISVVKWTRRLHASYCYILW